jgi:hypothetical protein
VRHIAGIEQHRFDVAPRQRGGDARVVSGEILAVGIIAENAG